MRGMKRFFIGLLAGLAWIALAGCGDDPVIIDNDNAGQTEVGIDGNPQVNPETPKPPKKERPPLPAAVLEEPYAKYFKEAVEFTDIHFGKWREGVEVDPLMAVFSGSSKDDVLYFRGHESTPYKGWVKHWHKNGSLGTLCYLDNGMKNGLSLIWHDNGSLHSQGYFSEGVEEGEWVFWNRDGNETKRESYEKGRRVKE